MRGAQILVVEDERIVAQDVRDILSRFGYGVAGVASSGSEAVQKAADRHPDLVLMDIKLNGTFDGVDTAEVMRTIFDIPVVYLTAHSAETMLERAKRTEPFGYLMKPFTERELHTTIQVALYKHEMEQKRKEREEQWVNTLKSIGEGVIGTDREGRVTFMNPVAEALTGWREEEALGKDVGGVFKIKDTATPGLAEDPVTRVIRDGLVIRLPNEGVTLIAKDETERPIADKIAPVRDANGDVTGAVVVFADVTERWQEDEERSKVIRRLQDELARDRALVTWFPICVFCKKVRDDNHEWHQIEAYIPARSDARFTESICGGCSRKKYPSVCERNE